MRRGLGVMLCCLDVCSPPSTSHSSVNHNIAIDTNINSSVDKEHFDQDTFSRLQ
jgi:hypothetical protein